MDGLLERFISDIDYMSDIIVCFNNEKEKATKKNKQYTSLI